MTLYTADTPEAIPAPVITRTYNLRTWLEMDRIQISPAEHHTLIVTGVKGAPATGYAYTIDGKTASAEEAYRLLSHAQTTGKVEVMA